MVCVHTIILEEVPSSSKPMKMIGETGEKRCKVPSHTVTVKQNNTYFIRSTQLDLRHVDYSHFGRELFQIPSSMSSNINVDSTFIF